MKKPRTRTQQDEDMVFDLVSILRRQRNRRHLTDTQDAYEQVTWVNIAHVLNLTGIETARGGPWTTGSVSNYAHKHGIADGPSDLHEAGLDFVRDAVRRERPE